MKNTPDIYADNPVITTEYIIAVMTAALAGKRLEGKSRRGLGAWSMLPLDTASWNWQTAVYRIDPSERPKPPKIKVPFTQETFPVGMIWLRPVQQLHGRHSLVVSLGPSYATANGSLFTFDFLKINYEYSLDRRTWFPCYTEIDAPELTPAPAHTQ